MTLKCIAYMTTRKKGKTDGIYEVTINGNHKYLPLNELKEKAGVRQSSQTKKIETWLNTQDGIHWAISVKPAKIF